MTKFPEVIDMHPSLSARAYLVMVGSSHVWKRNRLCDAAKGEETPIAALKSPPTAVPAKRAAEATTAGEAPRTEQRSRICGRV